MTTIPQTQEETFARAQELFGFVPNLIKEMVRSPVPARLYLLAQDLLAEGALTRQEQQAVQLAIAQENECDYCTAAHSAGGKMTGVETHDLEAIRNGKDPAEPHLAALVETTRLIMRNKGWLNQEEIERLEQKSVDRAKLYEIITLLGLKIISNYINHIAGTILDEELKS